MAISTALLTAGGAAVTTTLTQHQLLQNDWSWTPEQKGMILEKVMQRAVLGSFDNMKRPAYQGYMVDSSRRDSNTSTRNSRRQYQADYIHSCSTLNNGLQWG
jgi:hypothetical protein